MPKAKSMASERAIPSPGASAASARARVYQLKVAITGSRPPIWRRFQVPGDMTLGRLHRILQILIGWEDRHFHLFAAGRTVYRPTFPDLGFPSRDERRFLLAEVLPHERDRLRYEYDFRDGWQHRITVEKILALGVGSTVPVCLAGKRRAPPEESGGIIRYERLLAARRGGGRGEAPDGLGEGFDPEAFDLEAVNRRLAQLN